MSDLLNICLPCGICCNGTLIGFVQLDREEIPALKALMDVEDENDKGFFIQPCNSFSDRCDIYSERPKECAKFKCGFLKSVEQKELDFDTAIEIIDVVKLKKKGIEKKIDLLQIELQSQSFHFKMAELKILLQKKKSESTLNPNYLELISDLEQLDHLLSERFGVSLY